MKDGKVGFGIIGLGIGRSRCEMLSQAPEARLVAVCDLQEQRARDVAAAHGADWTTDYHDLLRRNDIDVIGVYTPSGLHRDLVVEAARAGKHVLTTKPLEVTLERADDVIATCRQAGVKLATEFASRYAPGHYALYEAIRRERFGRLILGEFSFKCYRDQSYYDADGGWRGTWKIDGGGALMNQTIHSVDLMLWLMGPAESVTARCGTYTHEIETEDTAVALVTFKNGALGTLVGTTTFHNDRPFKLYGGGVVKRNEVHGSLGSATMIDDRMVMWKVGDSDSPAEIPPPAKNVFQDYARWVLDDAYRSPTLVTADDARRSLAFILGVYESARTGETVHFP